MRVLVFSDSHGRNDTMKRAIEAAGPVDQVIHLGDIEGGEDALRRMTSAPCAIVAGNNDYYSKLPEKLILRLNGHKVLCVHGHRQRIYFGLEVLSYEAEEAGCDLVLFGPIHRPVDAFIGRVRIVNPGSISLPRQADRRKSYALIELEDDGLIKVTHHYV